MTVARSDALVRLDATGDLARKKIFPAPHAMVAKNAGEAMIGEGIELAVPPPRSR